jgi:putative acetyltransferase
MEMRFEHPADVAAIRAVNMAAFPTAAEADLVEILRRALVAASDLTQGGAAQGTVPMAFVSLVAEIGSDIVGHILFTPMTLEGDGPAVFGLAPMAVVPARQRSGIGSALVREGLARCRDAGAGAVVVLGHPEFYPRFGFVPASRFGLRCEYEVPDEAFMALEQTPGALAGRAGLARYHPAFAAV